MAKGMPADRQLASPELLPRSRPWRGDDSRRRQDPCAAHDPAKAIGTTAEARSADTTAAGIHWPGLRLSPDAGAGRVYGRSGSPDVLGMRKGTHRQKDQI